MPKSNYVIPFPVLTRELGLRDNKADAPIHLTREQLLTLIRRLLQSIPVDEKWYRTIYPDVAEAIETGVVKSAKDHFVTNGYFEGRQPEKVAVDEKYYISKYPDVQEGIELGEITSAQDHFERHGWLEGRTPFETSIP